MAKIEMFGSAAGLEDASRVPYRPSSLGKDGMRSKRYGVNTDLIYMYSQGSARLLSSLRGGKA